MPKQEIQKALDALEAGSCKMGAEWETAHNIAQAHEGQAAFDRIHALVHRIEGDVFNANYWYRRAGAGLSSGSLTDELAMLKTELLS